ncbi:hypothetical protein [Frigoribacterium faeni]|uniref:hypothetical protein n=1 Tax=Frigoribacterium faeni TaxID=145483 RepID=UPI0024137A85|nr:hypothetical protein [Frigoribacterium faeni]
MKFLIGLPKILSVGMILVLAFSLGVVACWAYLGLRDWAPNDSEGIIADPIAIRANAHGPLESLPLISDPSLDLYADLSSPQEPLVHGIFRVNVVHVVTNDGGAEIGLVLPLHSTFVFGGPGGDGVLSTTLLVPANVQTDRGLTCDSTLMGNGVADARVVRAAFAEGTQWTVDCGPSSATIWTHIPGEPDGAPLISDSSQEITSTSAAMIAFDLPDYAGLYRESFSTWSLNARVESGRELEGIETQSVKELLPDSDPVIALNDYEDLSITSPVPADSNRETRAFLKEMGTVWHRPLDGNVYFVSATVTSEVRARWNNFVAIAMPIVTTVNVGFIVTFIGLAWRRRRAGLHAAT